MIRSVKFFAFLALLATTLTATEVYNKTPLEYAPENKEKMQIFVKSMADWLGQNKGVRCMVLFVGSAPPPTVPFCSFEITDNFPVVQTMFGMGRVRYLHCYEHDFPNKCQDINTVIRGRLPSGADVNGATVTATLLRLAEFKGMRSPNSNSIDTIVLNSVNTISEGCPHFSWDLTVAIEYFSKTAFLQYS